MLKCREVSYLLSEAQDRPLNMSEALQLHLHLFMCKKCSHFSRQLKVIRLACKKKANDEDLH
ncbi:MAG: zf-HC2 domain-containing protein [Deefgea sp.]